MKLAVVGSRTIVDEALIFGEIDKIAKLHPNLSIVSGGAKGVDSIAAKWAKINKAPLFEFLPEWEKYGSRAGPIRNRDIVKSSDMVLAVWDGISAGTLSTIRIAKSMKIPVIVKLKTINS